MKAIYFFPLLFFVMGCACNKVSSSAQTTNPSTIPQSEVNWVKHRKTQGFEHAMIEGDRKKNEAIVMRFKYPKGHSYRPQWHSEDQRVTVLKGDLEVGFGVKKSKANMKTLKEGSYILLPAKTHYYMKTQKGATVQVVTKGPWKVNYSNKTKPAKTK